MTTTSDANGNEQSLSSPVSTPWQLSSLLSAPPSNPPPVVLDSRAATLSTPRPWNQFSRHESIHALALSDALLPRYLGSWWAPRLGPSKPYGSLGLVPMSHTSRHHASRRINESPLPSL
ncbi:hypothetical protein BO71DRAFT_397391 [Aspergillus ellipticus CBS 707.79]|uniref:Uncharacterized protein n=1 Tax=Aspergillus ellipticus CBS 707.79 TaxID=1448320 RepID=A0A319DF98_9EURO|nr:hypothetical protein BO71DRAFT_397391 [Aspergillus ellipticus CBS 707.79]